MDRKAHAGDINQATAGGVAMKLPDRNVVGLSPSPQPDSHALR